MLYRTLVFAATMAAGLAPSAHASLLAFYNFEGNANDVSGGGRNGTVSGATVTLLGYEGKAYDFDGSNDFITLPVNINPGAMPSLTMGAWVNTNTAAAIQAVLSHDNGGFDRNLNIDNRGCAPAPCWAAFTGSHALGGPQATSGAWNFLAARYNQAANTVTLDVGTSRKSGSTSMGSGWTTMRVGSNPGFGEYFNGRIDNVFLYDEILTDARIDEIRLGGAASILGTSGVPEPGSLALLGLGLAAFGLLRRR